MTEGPRTEDEIVWVDVTLTCRTEGCPSNGKPVPMTVPDFVDLFVCGACSQPIADPDTPAPDDEGGS